TYATSTNREIAADSAGSDFFYTAASGYKFNVRNEIRNSGSTNQTTSVNANFELNYQPIKGLVFQSLFGASQSNMTGYTWAGQRTEYVARIRGYDYGTVNATQAAYINSRLPVGGEYNENDNKNLTWNWRNSVSYSHIFGDRHAVTVMAGQEAMSSHYTGISFTQYGYLPERGKAFAAVPLTYTASNTANPLLAVNQVLVDRISNTMGLYSTLNYTYDNRYAFNFSVRGDASNRFGQYTGQRFNPVWAGGVRWNIMNEKWMARNAWLTGLSLRATLGYQRNMVDNFSPDLIARIPTGAAVQVIDAFTGENRLVVSSLPYGNLRWEKVLTMNYGLDFSLFNNRIAGTLEYYEKQGRDIIVTLPVPLEYGVNSMPVNGGNLTNRGAEIDLNFVPVRSKNFSWSINLNSSKTFSTLTKVGTQNPTWRNATSGNLYVKGAPVSGFWAFNFTGINPANGYPTFDLSVAKGGDPVNDPSSYMTYVGKLNPDFTGGLGMNFRYKA
ncbi:MAG: TonB-dependent receptor, partial [Bacteroidetes bacterium]|nr:TonB-dependent receptor [Bacteroidota bacterium]